MYLVDASHPAFWTPAERVSDVGPYLELAKKMLEFGASYNAAGVAAPQVGASIAMFVSKYEVFPIAFNPEWTAVGDDVISKPEGSLTKLGWSTYVARPALIHAEWYNALGDLCQADLKELDARVFCHLAQYCSGKQIFSRPPLAAAIQA